MSVKKYKEYWNGEPLIRRHLTMPESLFKLFQDEADDNFGGNLSFLLKVILEKHYNSKVAS